MADDSSGSYTYPNTFDDPDRQNVLRNKFGIRSNSELRKAEYRVTAHRITEIVAGHGPTGNFDQTHLKAIHAHIFQDVYEWAGHTRNERPIVDGQRVEPIGAMRKGGTEFLHGSRLQMGLDEAFKPIRSPDELRGSTPEQFAERAGRVLAELNFVHPFREGNGRTQEAFIAELGRCYGHEVDFSLISKPRMIEASIETTINPASTAMQHLVEDATHPNRSEAMRAAFKEMSAQGEHPLQHDVRTARAGERVVGQIIGHDDRVAVLVTDNGIVGADRADLPARLPGNDQEIAFTARSDFSRLGRPAEVLREGPVLPLARSEPLTPVELRRAIVDANKAFDRIESTLASDADKKNLTGAREEISNLLNKRLDEVRIAQAQQQPARPTEERGPPEAAQETQTPRPNETGRSRESDKPIGRDPRNRGSRDDYER
ncbi:MAG: cell filamentation protein Fic [Mesorhizobium sp.]|nr:MAG: cell filamentation protein Fic [Mesorhizobium sp.]